MKHHSILHQGIEVESLIRAFEQNFKANLKNKMQYDPKLLNGRESTNSSSQRSQKVIKSSKNSSKGTKNVSIPDMSLTTDLHSR